ncbi:hypothetical protein BGX34_005012 [Mortierella sp. NVP85]|nr:hypothetical protein BGX34_005012 [Mortierella sp. NVP85]
MSARKELSPLEVPEVLILVFAHLGLHSIRVHASLVCRLWYKVAAPILRARPLVWYRPDRESETVLSKRLQETKSLIIKKPNYRGTYHDVSVIWEDTSSWIELTKHLFEASQLQITELTILQRLERDIQVLPILAKIGPQLTRLRLSNMSRSDDVPLDRILILCPRLKVLHLHYLHLAYYHDNYRNQLSPSQQPVLPSRLELQSLTLECIGVEERSLLRLLESCSGLKELRLIQLLRATLRADRQPLPIAEKLPFFGWLFALLEQRTEGHCHPDIETIPRRNTMEFSILFCGGDAEGSENTSVKYINVCRDYAQDVYSGQNKRIASPISVRIAPPLAPQGTGHNVSSNVV